MEMAMVLMMVSDITSRVRGLAFGKGHAARVRRTLGTALF